ncbi:sensor histidine kinase [Dyadobacter arcticus]|uniref:histidine kinase n=1 Tax=Dyadobacter arcticus TaxID=1078754 RepID=A0ABX0UI98_9BACT|nr:HAMP domain-containing sensor histidine kinase [Dyadobacter arcticus]NIJ52743.1 signal transduction histidine kinase [Dyadobacter arcticus]
MKKCLYHLSHATFNQILPLCFFLLLGFTGCQESLKSDHSIQLKAWIDSIDRDARKIGIKRSIFLFDSLVATHGKNSIGDSMDYYKFMKVLSHRDPSLSQNALTYTDSLLQLFSNPRIRELYATEYSKALLLKGDDLFKQKEYYKAYRNYYSGKSFLLGLGEICECARYSSRIANISYKEENYYQAIEYWKHELKELAQCKEPENFQLQFIEKQGSLRNIGSAYLLLSKADVALHYFQQAKDFINKHAPEFPREKNYVKFARIVILKSQAEAYALKGETKIAEGLLKQCLQHDVEIDWSIDVERESRQILTRIYIDSKQYSEAEKQLSILKALPGAADSTTVSLYQKLQAYISFGQGNFEEAGRLFIANLETDRANKLAKNADHKSNVGQLLQQIEREHEIELATQKDARENLILKFAILISITLCIIVYLIWRSAKKSAANLRAVTELNRVITQSNIVLQDTVNALEQAEIENESVLRIVAHDLRNPIAAMISASHLVFWEQIPSDEQLEIINAIQQSGEMANGLISHILQSSPDRNKITKSNVALEEIVQSCIDMLSYKAREKDQKLDYHFEPAMVPVDREKIWRVFSNLLSNAIKFSPSGGTIWVNLKPQNGHVLLSVRDNGIGIPEELKDQIFLPLNKAKRSGTAGEQSFGIGLSICKQIVESHGGRIWFESIKGSGATFFVELPS